MKQIVALAASSAGVAHARLAAEALRAAAQHSGHGLKTGIATADAPLGALSVADIAAADVVVLAVDESVNAAPFAGKPVYETRTSAAIRHPQAILDAALARLPAAVDVSAKPAPASAAQSTSSVVTTSAAHATTASVKRLVAITSCPTGIAHTFMAAEALKKSAAALGHQIRVETQGSVGAKSQLTA
ncbi:MAG: PTS fructose transporter subunit EIIBC, partial [Rariglobus sp.]